MMFVKKIWTPFPKFQFDVSCLCRISLKDIVERCSYVAPGFLQDKALRGGTLASAKIPFLTEDVDPTCWGFGISSVVAGR